LSAVRGCLFSSDKREENKSSRPMTYNAEITPHRKVTVVLTPFLHKRILW